jgi:hypothetical protein
MVGEVVVVVTTLVGRGCWLVEEDVKVGRGKDLDLVGVRRPSVDDKEEDEEELVERRENFAVRELKKDCFVCEEVEVVGVVVPSISGREDAWLDGMDVSLKPTQGLILKIGDK